MSRRCCTWMARLVTDLHPEPSAAPVPGLPVGGSLWMGAWRLGGWLGNGMGKAGSGWEGTGHASEDVLVRAVLDDACLVEGVRKVPVEVGRRHLLPGASVLAVHRAGVPDPAVVPRIRNVLDGADLGARHDVRLRSERREAEVSSGGSARWWGAGRLKGSRRAVQGQQGALEPWYRRRRRRPSSCSAAVGVEACVGENGAGVYGVVDADKRTVLAPPGAPAGKS